VKWQKYRILGTTERIFLLNFNQHRPQELIRVGGHRLSPIAKTVWAFLWPLFKFAGFLFHNVCLHFTVSISIHHRYTRLFHVCWSSTEIQKHFLFQLLRGSEWVYWIRRHLWEGAVVHVETRVRTPKWELLVALTAAVAPSRSDYVASTVSTNCYSQGRPSP
jgi:hypothetical protein